MTESFIIQTESRTQDQEQTKAEIYTWGWNEHGNLALRDKIDRAEPTLVPFDCTTHPIQKVVAGGAFFFLLTA